MCDADLPENDIMDLDSSQDHPAWTLMSIATETPARHGPQAGLTTQILEEFSDILVDELPISPPDGAVPAKLRPYRLPLHLQQELKKTIDFLLERKIIEKNSQAAWQAPLLFVKKGVDKESKPVFRMCVDYRRLNLALTDDNFLPLVPHEAIEKVGRTLAARRHGDDL
eukprot:691388-Hanusia_phi.AAC.1